MQVQGQGEKGSQDVLEGRSRPSLRKAINAMCKGCIYDPMDKGTWREQVQACTSEECPLWAHRPLPRPRAARGQGSMTP